MSFNPAKWMREVALGAPFHTRATAATMWPYLDRSGVLTVPLREFAEGSGRSYETIRTHLQTLEEEGFVDRSGYGQPVRCTLPDTDSNAEESAIEEVRNTDSSASNAEESAIQTMPNAEESVRNTDSSARNTDSSASPLLEPFKSRSSLCEPTLEENLEGVGKDDPRSVDDDGPKVLPTGDLPEPYEKLDHWLLEKVKGNANHPNLTIGQAGAVCTASVDFGLSPEEFKRYIDHSLTKFEGQMDRPDRLFELLHSRKGLEIWRKRNPKVSPPDGEKSEVDAAFAALNLTGLADYENHALKQSVAAQLEQDQYWLDDEEFAEVMRRVRKKLAPQGERHVS